VLTGMMSNDLKIEQAARIYQLTKGNNKEKALFHKDMKVRYWQHPVEGSISSMEEKEEKVQYKYIPMKAKQIRVSAHA
jgi:hypothetical protein